MVDIVRYKSYTDYDNVTGIYKILYPVRDAVTIINPYFVTLFGLMMVLIVASYFSAIGLTGKSRMFNSVLASSFVTFVVAIFFALAGLVSPYAVLFFIAITILSLGLIIFYK